MRTTELNIDGIKKEAVLLAGGSGFKIYSASNVDGWIIARGRSLTIVNESSPEFRIVSRYINLKFQPHNEHDSIKSDFKDFLDTKTSSPKVKPKKITTSRESQS